MIVEYLPKELVYKWPWLKKRSFSEQGQVNLSVQINRGLWHCLGRFILKKILLAPRFFLVVIIWTLSPFVKVRIGVLQHYRIGHLAFNTELFLRRQSEDKNKGRKVHLFLSKRPINRQLLRMIKRRVLVLEAPFLTDLARAFLKGSFCWIDLPCKNNEYYEFNKIPPQLSFIEEEKKEGESLLEDMGLKAKQEFVCFTARESNYLNKVNSKVSPEEWHYHNFRDCQINNYLGAAEYLSTKGIYAIRMGYLMDSVLPETNSYIIDYAIRHRTDLGDIFLPAKCKFYLGSTTGACVIPQIFNRPIAYANWIPMGIPPLQNFTLYILKKLWFVEGRRFLTFKEIVEGGSIDWAQTEKYSRAGIEVIDNTEDEILSLAIEMNERIDGTWITTDEDEELQKRYHNLFPKGHSHYGSPSSIGAEFLRQNRELLD